MFRLDEQTQMVADVVRQWCTTQLAPKIPALEAGTEQPFDAHEAAREGVRLRRDARRVASRSGSRSCAPASATPAETLAAGAAIR